MDWIAVRLMSMLPSTRRTWKAATVRIAQNAETINRLPSALRPNTEMLNHAEFHRVALPGGAGSAGGSGPYVAWVSPMESRKGPELAVRALAATPSPIRMVMAGDGPERGRIEGLVRDLGVDDRVDFVGMVPHRRALEIIQGAEVAIFTGMREEGGLALAEALLLGTPVVVLANGGADAIARAASDPQDVVRVEPRSTDETVTMMAAALVDHVKRQQDRPKRERAPLIDQTASVDRLQHLVRAAAEADADAP
jgi:glycosyltransferase involved in cell wall biosynthesis